MSNSRWFGLLGLAGLAMSLLASPALAQKVVVLEFEGDKLERLRSQVESAIKVAGVVEVVPLARYKDAAARRKLKGASAMTPAAVGKLAQGLGLDAAVEGALGDTFFIRILDGSGQELWSKDLPLKGGLISADHARKLAKAVAVAAQTASSTKVAPPEEQGGDSPLVAVEADTPTVKPERTETVATTLPEIDLTASGPASGGSGPSGETGRVSAPEVDGERDSDLDNNFRRKKVRTGPKLVTVAASGSTVWRAYCSRPGGAAAGVSSCHDYDAKEVAARPKGDTVDFSPQVPYAGFTVNLELFPLWFLEGGEHLGHPGAGFGVAGTFGRGWSLTNVRVQTPSGETPEKQVVSVDDSIDAAGLWRLYFSYGDRREPLIGYAGIRVGYSTRTFEVDPAAQVPLPGSHRGYLTTGLDLSFPLAKLVRIEAAGLYFWNPKAGPDEIAGYGNPAAFEGGALGSGFGFEGGLSGTIVGPVGYSVRFKIISYADQFYGGGQKWPCDDTQCGGAAEETYSGLTWGVSASF